jgi:hypothetical protein
MLSKGSRYFEYISESNVSLVEVIKGKGRHSEMDCAICGGIEGLSGIAMII